MNKKSIIITILLAFVVILSISSVSAEDTIEDTQLQDSYNIEPIQIDESSESSSHTIKANSDSATIQEAINALKDGDTLNFESGEYKDICIYVNKSITINGNGAKLIGYDTPSKDNTPDIIYKDSDDGGYAIGNFATLYLINANGITINGLTIVGGANSASTYSNTVVYATGLKNLNFTDNIIEGSSWGLYMNGCQDGSITSNTIKYQTTTGILNFGSPRTVISNNLIVDAANHGIDVRHGTGPNVQVINNRVIGSAEGIYLMHSKGHTARNNTLINCSISSITCYGSSNINLKNNKMQKSRIGILLGGEYDNITVDANEFNLENLPFPPTFVYYVAEAKSDYNSAAKMIGIHSDSSSNAINYEKYSEIATPKEISIDYTAILTPTGTIYNVTEEMTNSQIQDLINSMADGDTLSFKENAVFNNISIYTDKNIKILGNNATLIGLNTIDLLSIPEKVRKESDENGYGVGYRAVLYILNNTNVAVSDLNIVGKYPGYDTTKATTSTNEYKSVGIYAESKNITITGCDVQGASSGIFLNYCSNAIITKNNIHDVYTTGIMNFGSPNSIIADNKITNAVNHGIDVRHGSGPNAIVFNNTITGSKEGIYLMHSKGHNVYNNTVLNSKISGITAYGSGNENIFNNTIHGSRIAILLGGGYYNVTIGPNTCDNSMQLPFPPTFAIYLVKAENKYQTADNVIRTYSDKETVTINADEIKTIKNNIDLKVTLTDSNGKVISKQTIKVSVDNGNYTATTDENGVATISLALGTGKYSAEISYAGNDNYKSATGNVNITIASQKENTSLDAANITVGYKKGIYTIVLTDSENKPIAKQNLLVTIGNTNYTLTTDEKGSANITLSLTTGTYAVTAEYAGTEDYYNPQMVTSSITVLDDRTATSITAPSKSVYLQAIAKGTKYQITLKDANGKALSGKAIVVNFNGQKLKATTNSKGVASLTLKATKVASLKASITFAGDDEYKPASASATIKVSKEASKLTAKKKTFKAKTKIKKYTITLKSKSGKAIAKAKVTIKVKGKTYKATTTAKGKATFKITKLNKKGKSIATIKFAGNAYFNKVTKKVKITVKK